MKSDQRYVRFIVDCCEALEVDPEDVLGTSRERGPVMEARFLLTYLLRSTFQLSYPAIARVMCRLDHTTSMHADRSFKRLLEKSDPRARAALARVAGVTKLAGLERPLDSLRYCGVDNGVEIELATEAVG